MSLGGKGYGRKCGLHFLVEIKCELAEAELIDLCKGEGIRVYGISEYFISRTSSFQKPVLLFGYGGLTELQMQEGLTKIGRILADIRA